VACIGLFTVGSLSLEETESPCNKHTRRIGVDTTNSRVGYATSD